MSNDYLVGALKSKQRAWAAGKGIEIYHDGYCHTFDDNFFQPLSASSRSDLGAGDGSELGQGGGRGKIQALHSSAALVCNFFDYWRGRDLDLLAQALGISARLCRVKFEQKFPTGLGGIAPNLDVVLHGSDGTLFAIESKFLEPFTRSKTKCFLKPKYFPEGPGLWENAGLSGCQKLAEGLRDGTVKFELLDVAQLLKHILGLARSPHTYHLTCLWYGPGGSLSDQHAQELTTFSEQIGLDSTRFTALTYQVLFDRLASLSRDKHEGWKSYLQHRYFKAE